MLHRMNEYGWGMGWLWIIGLILIVIIWLVTQRRYRNKDVSQYPEKTAFDILKERYARGEINKQEFDERKKDLN